MPIYAELSLSYDSIDTLDARVADLKLALLDLPRAALFLAGQAFRKYRRAGGSRSGVLPDFFIGAHAAVLDCAILTRDAARYRRYFPTVELLTPPWPPRSISRASRARRAKVTRRRALALGSAAATEARLRSRRGRRMPAP